MNLIGLVVAGQGVHDEIDPKPESEFPLSSAAGDNREHRTPVDVDRPCRCVVIGSDDDR